MGEFFHGWRRKVGAVTLLMACVFAAGWVRSLTLLDEITLPILPIRGFGAGLLISENGCFICTWSMSRHDEIADWETTPLSDIQIVDMAMPPGMWEEIQTVEPERERLVADGTVPAADGIIAPPRPQVGRGKWRDIFHGGSLTRGGGDEHRFIRYSPFVIFLTLISAFLLLTKPRKSSQTKPIEPIAEKAE